MSSASSANIQPGKITALFFDVGGVLLSNAWDRSQRERTLHHFHLDEAEFSDRHEMLASSFERGKISLREYLDRTIFYRERDFTTQQFEEYMLQLSQPDDEALAFVRALASSGEYFMGTINNESRELNDYRVEKFGLRQIFDIFVSSCFVGFRKPEEAIYRLALDITQRVPAQCCFIDDRPLNVDTARKMGMHAIRMQSAAQLRQDLQALGVGL